MALLEIIDEVDRIQGKIRTAFKQDDLTKVSELSEVLYDLFFQEHKLVSQEINHYQELINSKKYHFLERIDMRDHIKHLKEETKKYTTLWKDY